MRLRRKLIQRACPLRSRSLSQSWRQSWAWTDTLRVVAKEYIARRDRDTDPPGRFDKAGRWYAHETERRDCCWPIRSPSRAYPYSWLVHCRTAKHVADLYAVPRKRLLRAARLIDGPRRASH